METTRAQPFPSRRRPVRDRRIDGVVVGFDGTWHSRPALERAADEAVDRQLRLTVLTVVATPSDPHLSVRDQDADATDRWDQTVGRANAAVAELRSTHPGLAVDVDVVHEDDLGQVEQALGETRLIVLGDGGAVGPRAFLLGSISRRLVRGTRCPILVVPESSARHDRSVGDAAEATVLTGAVLVGAAPGPAVVGLLRLAGAEASRRRERLCVLHSYDHTPTRAEDVSAHPADVQTQVQQWIAAADLDPEVHVTTILTPDPPVDALVRLGRSAELLVVGSRGPIAMARLALDSVSRGVLDAIGGPVLVVPHPVAEAMSSAKGSAGAG